MASCVIGTLQLIGSSVLSVSVIIRDTPVFVYTFATAPLTDPEPLFQAVLSQSTGKSNPESTTTSSYDFISLPEKDNKLLTSS